MTIRTRRIELRYGFCIQVTTDRTHNYVRLINPLGHPCEKPKFSHIKYEHKLQANIKAIRARAERYWYPEAHWSNLHPY